MKTRKKISGKEGEIREGTKSHLSPADLSHLIDMRRRLNTYHLAAHPEIKHVSHLCNGLQSWNLDMRAASERRDEYLTQLWCSGNNNILGFVYYTPWVSHSNEYSSYSDVVHCVKWCVQRTLKIVHCANEYQCLLSTNVVKILFLALRLLPYTMCAATSPPPQCEKAVRRPA